ncbi:hypothetical protein FOZ62_026610, partial [Perkinsus olseni]
MPLAAAAAATPIKVLPAVLCRAAAIPSYGTVAITATRGTPIRVFAARGFSSKVGSGSGADERGGPAAFKGTSHWINGSVKTPQEVPTPPSTEGGAAGASTSVEEELEGRYGVAPPTSPEEEQSMISGKGRLPSKEGGRSQEVRATVDAEMKKMSFLQKSISDFNITKNPRIQSEVKKYGRKAAVKGRKAAVWTLNMTGRFLLGTFRVTWSFIRNPRIVFQWWADLKEALHHMSAWVKNGSKLFGKNVQLSTQLVMKQARGYQLTLREHKLLVRTVTDLFKLVPFSLFIIIPFAELALPVALRLFPNMLPSTFNDKKSDHALLMRRMKAKGEMAAFFNEVIAEKNKQILEEESSKFRDRAIELQEFQEEMLERLEEGEGSGPYFPSVLELKRFSKLFHSEFQLEQMSVEQLRAICTMLGLRPYAFKSHIVLQLRHYVTRLRSEDRDILWEGVKNLTHAELSEANRMRGMPYVNVDDDRLRAQLSSWLEVSSNKDIPVSLLLWSRTFFMAQQPGMERERLVSELNNTLTEANAAAEKAKAHIKKEAPPHEAPQELASEKKEEAVLSESLLKREVERRKGAAETSAKRLEELEREARQIEEERTERRKVAETITEATGVDADSGVIRSDKPPEAEVLKDPAAAAAASGELPAASPEYPIVDSDDEKLDRDELLRKIDRLEEELELYQSVVEKQQLILMRQIGHLS